MCSSFSTTRWTACWNSCRVASSRSGKPVVQTLHLARDDGRGAGPQGGDGRGDGLHHPRGDVHADLPRDQVADGLDLGQRLDVRSGREGRPEVGQPDERRARQVRDGGVDVVRQGQVDEDAVVRALGGRRGDKVGPDEVLGGAGRGDHDVGLGDRLDQPLHRDGASARRLGQALATGEGAVRDDERTDATTRRRRGGEAGHPAGADDEDGTRREVAEHALGLVEAGLHERPADRVDRGLVMRPLADPKCLLQKEFSDSPTVPARCPARSASRSWPRTWASPTAIESSPAATANAWATARSSKWT